VLYVAVKTGNGYTGEWMFDRVEPEPTGKPPGKPPGKPTGEATGGTGGLIGGAV
jgi:hypothetical protein